MTREELKRNGYFEKDGKEYVLLSQAYISDGNTYEAKAVSFDDPEEEGFRKVYKVTWSVREDYDPAEMEEDQACDWENPDEVEESGNEYNAEESRALKADTLGKRYICPICGKEFEKHTPQATCSPECERELKRVRQNEADIMRGKRKLPAADRRKVDLPQSGVPGVSYNRKLKKWQVAYKGRYIGVYT